jgi:hypothetical protein
LPAFVLPARACAQPSPSADVTSAARVEVIVLGRAADLEWIRGAMGPGDFGGARADFALGERWNLDEVFRPSANANAEVWCWIDVTTPSRARLYFADAERERFLLRDVSLPDGLSDLGREAIAQVLQMSVTALLEDRRSGMSRADAERVLAEPPTPGPAPRPKPRPAPAQPPAATRSATRSATLELGAFYAARLDSTEVPVTHGPGVVLCWITSRGALGSLVAASVQYELPEEHMAQRIGLKWQTTALRLGFELAHTLGDREQRLGARLGAGVDFVHLTPERAASDPDVALTAERSITLGAGSAALGFCSPVASWIGGCAQIFGDFYPTRVRYELALDESRSRVLEPFRVRPGLALSLVVR